MHNNIRLKKPHYFQLFIKNTHKILAYDLSLRSSSENINKTKTLEMMTSIHYGGTQNKIKADRNYTQ